VEWKHTHTSQITLTIDTHVFAFINQSITTITTATHRVRS
jgi:hypothetical protein